MSRTAWDSLIDVVTAYVSDRSMPGGDSVRAVILAAIGRTRAAALPAAPAPPELGKIGIAAVEYYRAQRAVRDELAAVSRSGKLSYSYEMPSWGREADAQRALVIAAQTFLERGEVPSPPDPDPIQARIDALTDDEVSAFAQRCRAHPTAGYFDVKLVRRALEKLFGGVRGSRGAAGAL